jgi:hypothetical protein
MGSWLVAVPSALGISSYSEFHTRRYAFRIVSPIISERKYFGQWAASNLMATHPLSYVAAPGCNSSISSYLDFRMARNIPVIE